MGTALGSLRAITVIVAAASLFAGLLVAMLSVPDVAPVALPAMVAEQLDRSGVSHGVTAVLLNFRGYDTLLEVAVVLLAFVGVLVAKARHGPFYADPIQPRTTPRGERGVTVLATLARAVLPVMVLMAGYLLWAGAHRPGGAFQAAAVLAGAWVLLHLAGVMPAWSAPGALLRATALAGLLVFVGVGAGTALVVGSFLHYRDGFAGVAIFAIESSLTVSLSVVLAGLFLSRSDDARVRR